MHLEPFILVNSFPLNPNQPWKISIIILNDAFCYFMDYLINKNPPLPDFQNISKVINWIFYTNPDNTRSSEHFLVNFAKTESYCDSAIPYIQMMLNDYVQNQQRTRSV